MIWFSVEVESNDNTPLYYVTKIFRTGFFYFYSVSSPVVECRQEIWNQQKTTTVIDTATTTTNRPCMLSTMQNCILIRKCYLLMIWVSKTHFSKQVKCLLIISGSNSTFELQFYALVNLTRIIISFAWSKNLRKGLFSGFLGNKRNTYI